MSPFQAGPALRAWWQAGSGPRTAWIYHGALALCALSAWLSLAVQVETLIGSQGLLPLEPLVRSFADLDHAVWPRFPTLLLLDPGDGALRAGVWLGAGLAAAALLGVLPRACFALQAPLYLSYAVAGRDFLSFQWDNLLIESLVLASFVPRRRASPGPHWMMRLLLFKLYFESGIAKAQSYLGDWFDGSAMSFYYETAPLPAWPGWYAHQLPAAWHVFESWAALGLEGVVAFAILGTRRSRLVALVGFTGFQLLNLATANYGFFVWLTLALHVFLLEDQDWQRAARWLGARRQVSALRPWRIPVARIDAMAARIHPASAALAWLLALLWLGTSTGGALAAFTPPGPTRDAVATLVGRYRPYRVANTYHLFGHITRERIEPEFQLRTDGRWQAWHLRYKPGDPTVPPPFVAPHQPRVDFLLWFYGLGFRHPAPEYVLTLLERLCTHPRAVQSLFARELPARPEAVRLEYWRYHFTDFEERRRTGAWWRRESVGRSQAIECPGPGDPARSG